MHRPSILFSILCLLYAAPAWAAPPALRFPLKCTPGTDCWIVNYMDDASGPDAKDYTCGPRTYDGHDGTDIGLPDRVAMEGGVAVLAAADGQAVRVRDEMEDHEPSPAEMAGMLKNSRGCGNGVLIDHGDGWRTIYCHMKKDSIAVHQGQAIRAGDILGRAGQSGAAEFPHLHLGVIHNGTAIDPFTGSTADKTCGGGTDQSLWAKDAMPVYEPVIVYAAGFHGGIPDFEAIKIDSTSPRRVGTKDGILSFWAAFYGLKDGDHIRMSITASDGTEIAQHEQDQKGNKARQFFYIGRKNVQPGSYKGVAIVDRTAPNAPPIHRTIERSVIVQ